MALFPRFVARSALGVTLLVAWSWCFADQTCYHYRGNAGAEFSSPGAACASFNSTSNPDNTYQYQSDGSTGPGAHCTGTHNVRGGDPPQVFSYPASINLEVIVVICPPSPCAAKAGKTQNITISGAAPNGSGVDAQGCAYTVTASVTVSAGGNTSSTFDATYTGAGGTPGGGQPGDCSTNGTITSCSEKQQGKNCGTFNGDEVCVAAIPPGTCQSFASGGVACTAAADGTVASPPVPNNGTTGTPATPTGSVSTPSSGGGGAGGSTTTNYYSSTVVGGSLGGVVSSPGGKNVGNGGTGSGSGSGSGTSQPNPANGDCGADGVSCDPGLPTLPTEPTLQETANSYYAAVANAPIVAAVSGIAAAIPAGQCPTATYSVFGHQFTMDSQCQLWDSISPVLQLIFLAMWTLVGVRILMSA